MNLFLGLCCACINTIFPNYGSNEKTQLVAFSHGFQKREIIFIAATRTWNDKTSNSYQRKTGDFLSLILHSASYYLTSVAFWFALCTKGPNSLKIFA